MALAERELSPPEGIEPPDGLTLFNELPNKTADELFIDEVSDFTQDRDWWLAALKESLKPETDECELGRLLRLKIIDLATQAGDSQYAVEVWTDEEMRARYE